MFISENQARAFRHKRADMMLTKTELAKKIGVTRITLSKIERGNYKAPKRIYRRFMTATKKGFDTDQSFKPIFTEY